MGTGLRPAAALAAVWLAMAVSRTTEAKTPGYIVTGGELGEYAAQIYVEYAVEIPNEHAVLSAPPPPSAPPDSGYLLYSYWPFTAAQQLAAHEPAATYYPKPGLVLAAGKWLELDAAAKQSLDGAIIEAKARAGRGELQTSPVYAGLELYFGEASFVITGGDSSPARARAMPLRELAAVLEQAPVANAGEQPGRGTAITVYATPRNAGQIVFFLYQPPHGNLAGRLWPPDAAETHYWLTTADFDRAFALVPRTALLPGEVAVEAPGVGPSVATVAPAEVSAPQPVSTSGRVSGWRRLATAISAVALFAAAIAAGARGLRRRRSSS